MNSERKLSIVVLAAGKGKRMLNPDKAKVTYTLGGLSLIEHVLRQVDELKADKIIVVVGHKKEDVIEHINSLNIKNIYFVEQNEQLGTGHAVAQAESELKDFKSDVLILAGDVPLLKASTLKSFIEAYRNDNAVISDLTTIVPDATGYGRVVKDSNNNFIKIVEHKDATDAEKQINEINSGIFIVDSDYLFSSLKEIKNNNAQGEYYLTDIIDVLRKQDCKVTAYLSANYQELQGVNSLDDLKTAELYLNKDCAI